MIRARHSVQVTALRHRLGMSVSAIILLAAIAALRVPLHDLDVVSEGSFVAWLGVFVPLALWLVVVLRRRVPNPFFALVVIGVAYGAMLALIHQLLWVAAYDGSPPSPGGNLEGVLAPGLEALVFRTAAFLSSLMTGTLVGVVIGAIAWVIERLRRT